MLGATDFQLLKLQDHSDFYLFMSSCAIDRRTKVPVFLFRGRETIHIHQTYLLVACPRSVTRHISLRNSNRTKFRATSIPFSVRADVLYFGVTISSAGNAQKSK